MVLLWLFRIFWSAPAKVWYAYFLKSEYFSLISFGFMPSSWPDETKWRRFLASSELPFHVVISPFAFLDVGLLEAGDPLDERLLQVFIDADLVEFMAG